MEQIILAKELIGRDRTIEDRREREGERTGTAIKDDTGSSERESQQENLYPDSGGNSGISSSHRIIFFRHSRFKHSTESFYRSRLTHVYRRWEEGEGGGR